MARVAPGTGMGTETGTGVGMRTVIGQGQEYGQDGDGNRDRDRKGKGNRDENGAWSRNRGGDGDEDKLETGTGTGLGTGLVMQTGMEPGIGTGLEHSWGWGEPGARWKERTGRAVGSASEGRSPDGLRGGCDSLGTLLPTWVSLLESKPLAGASTRPRRVSVSGVSWFRSLNCRQTGSGRRLGTPVPHSMPVLKAGPTRGGCGPPGQPPLTVSPPISCGSTAYRGVRGATSASTRTTSPSAARHSHGSPVPTGTHGPHRAVPPGSYPRWRRGHRSAAPAPPSPGQRAAPPPRPHRDKRPAGSGCTGSSGGHQAPHRHAASPARGHGAQRGGCGLLPRSLSPAPPLPGTWWQPQGRR